MKRTINISLLALSMLDQSVLGQILPTQTQSDITNDTAAIATATTVTAHATISSDPDAVVTQASSPVNGGPFSDFGGFPDIDAKPESDSTLKSSGDATQTSDIFPEISITTTTEETGNAARTIGLEDQPEKTADTFTNDSTQDFNVDPTGDANNRSEELVDDMTHTATMTASITNESESQTKTSAPLDNQPFSGFGGLPIFNKADLEGDANTNIAYDFSKDGIPVDNSKVNAAFYIKPESNSPLLPPEEAHNVDPNASPTKTNVETSTPANSEPAKQNELGRTPFSDLIFSNNDGGESDPKPEDSSQDNAALDHLGENTSATTSYIVPVAAPTEDSEAHSENPEEALGAERGSEELPQTEYPGQEPVNQAEATPTAIEELPQTEYPGQEAANQAEPTSASIDVFTDPGQEAANQAEPTSASIDELPDAGQEPVNQSEATPTAIEELPQTEYPGQEAANQAEPTSQAPIGEFDDDCMDGSEQDLPDDIVLSSASKTMAFGVLISVLGFLI
jgi:hypothetical protein